MKRIHYLLTFAIHFIFSVHASASEHNSTINGRVENNGQGVPHVAVYIKGSQHGVSTDATGNFTISCTDCKNLVIGVKGLGYKTSYHEIKTANIAEGLVLSIEQDYLMLEQVLVSGSRIGILRYLPGSASIISQADLRASVPLSGNEVLRNITGVHVVEEEGAGLRANIGIRGLDPDKSRNVLILEDGIPVALAPYGEPEMYYTPSIDRMSGIEVLKGNGTILFGPQTIGGVINFLTADPPAEARGMAALQAGNKGFYNARFNYGNTVGNFGFNVDLHRKQAENFGPTAFTYHDFSTKLQTHISPLSVISLKLSIYDEKSNSTYIGLTQSMFNAGNLDDLRIAPDDNLHIRRYALSAIHKYSPASGLQFNTTAFAYTTARNWNRQDFTYTASATNLTGVVHGFSNETEGAIYLINSTGQRNRQFEVAGFEPRLAWTYKLFGMDVKTDAGVRYLYEKAFEQRVVGTLAGTRSGNLREDEIRLGHTTSAFFQNKFVVGEKFTVTAGVRNENIWYTRETMRLNFKDTLITAGSEVFAIIPGAGINYNLTSNVGFFAGLHRGFAPPRTKDAITITGENLELDAEKSWNSELGARVKLAGMELEYTLFRMDFSNQVIPVSESSGGAGTGFINGGETLHQGMELSLLMPFDLFLPKKWNAQMSVAGTWVNSVFASDRYVLAKTSRVSSVPNVYENVKGNKTPYAPELTLTAALTVEHETGWGMRLWGNYIGSQFTDALNTVDVYQWIELAAADANYRYAQATANGRIGKLDPYTVINLSAWYEHKATGLGFNVSVKNLLDERYIATRRPQGIRAGMPRFISAGINYRL